MSTTKVAMIRPKSESERKTRTVVDTIMVTPESVAKWKSPLFQRPVNENAKVLALAEELKLDGGVWPGIVTLGMFQNDLYIIDGQHRRKAFLISGLQEGYTDIRTHYFTDMVDMGEEFVKLNSQLARMRPDDILRGLEGSIPLLGLIRQRCPFVGYDMIRKSPKAPIVSMSGVIRQWRASAADVPSSNVSGMGTTGLARTLNDEDTGYLIDFLTLAVQGFGREPEYYRLWGALNFTLCMWLYRRLVVTQYSQKSVRLSREMFKKCLMSLSANGDYLDWLVGRMLSERDRSPAYTKIKQTFGERLFAETGKKPMLPQPSWHSGSSYTSTGRSARP